MELIKEKEIFCERVFCEKERVTVEEDIIVPDTKPDILKVLQVDARAYVTDKGIVSGGVYVQGKLFVNILYIPESDSEGIGCIKTSFDFKTKIDNPGISSGMSLRVMSDVSRADFMAINSRKLSIKATVCLECEIFAEKEMEFACELGGTDNECIYENISQDRVSAISDCEFEVRESFELASGKKSISEIIKSDAKIIEKEIKLMQSKLILKGVLELCILYLTEDKKTDYIEEQISFTEVIDVYELEENDRCMLNLSIGEINTELMQDNDGDFRIINVNALIGVSVCASRQKEIRLICDCYCPGMKTKINSSEAFIKSHVSNLCEQNTVKEIIQTESKLPQIVKIYNTIAEPEIVKVQPIAGAVNVEGRLKVYILYITDNSKCPVYSLKKDIPFSFNYECENVTQGMMCSSNAEVQGVACNLNSSGDIEFKCVLKQEICITENKKINVIEDINVEENKNSGDIIIYFVRKGDTLWNIAKKYSVRTADILTLNAIGNDEIFEGQKLIIPNN